MPKDKRRDLAEKELEWGVHFKNCHCLQGGVQLSYVIILGGGKVLIHHTFLTPHHPPPPPLRDVINDRSLKPFMNWFIGECFTPLSSSLRASEVLRTSHFASDFGCFHVADQETDFVHFLQIETAFSKTNYIRFSYLLIPNCGRDISKNEFLTVAAKCRFCLMFTDICS